MLTCVTDFSRRSVDIGQANGSLEGLELLNWEIAWHLPDIGSYRTKSTSFPFGHLPLLNEGSN